MTNANSLPDLDQLPSVLETSQVNQILRRALDAAHTNDSVTQLDAIGCMVDAIFARGYRPDEHFDVELGHEISNWIIANWIGCDVEFADAATTVLTNLPGKTVDQHVHSLVESEQRAQVIQMLNQCIAERENAG